ncbi:hypothetical protein AAT18_23350 [Rhodococcus aetherivorans]|nr:hypothetical protein AAT18_23350 [Rhodococcus aetherivorans]
MLAGVGLAEAQRLAQVTDAEFAVPQLVDDEQSLGVGDGLADSGVEFLQLCRDVLFHHPSEPSVGCRL